MLMLSTASSRRAAYLVRSDSQEISHYESGANSKSAAIFELPFSLNELCLGKALLSETH